MTSRLSCPSPRRRIMSIMSSCPAPPAAQPAPPDSASWRKKNTPSKYALADAKDACRNASRHAGNDIGRSNPSAFIAASLRTTPSVGLYPVTHNNLLYATQKTNPFMLAAHTHAVTLLHLIKHQNVTKHINKAVDHPATTRYPNHMSWAFHGRVSPNNNVQHHKIK